MKAPAARGSGLAYLIAFDVGTSSCKAVLFDEALRVVSACGVPYPTYYPRPGWAEQRPEEWWDALTSASRQLLIRAGVAPGSIAAIGLSGHMMGCVPVDADGNALYPSLIHSDTRSQANAVELAARLGDDRLFALTGNRIDPHYPLPKLAWIRQHEPDIWKRARFFLQAKDYLAAKLTGRVEFTDFTDASLTGLMDIGRRQWSVEILSALDLSEKRLPTPVPSSQVIGRVTMASAAVTGLPAGIPVVAGAGDGGCATAGSGAAAFGQAYHYLGSTSWIAALTEAPLADPRLFHWIDMDPGRYVVAGTVQSAGSACEWAADQLGERETDRARMTGESRYALLDQLAAAAEPGCKGLIFLPYLMGERSPVWDPQARGVFFGLTLSHTRADLVRAVLEGVALALRDVLGCIEDSLGSLTGIRLIGGGAASPLWRGILAAAFDRPLSLPSDAAEATARGAAIAAGVGIGLFPSVAAGAAAVNSNPLPPPAESLVNEYRRAYGLYRTLYPDLRAAFERLAVTLGDR